MKRQVIKTWSDKAVSNAIDISNQHHSSSVKHKSLLFSSKLLIRHHLLCYCALSATDIVIYYIGTVSEAAGGMALGFLSSRT